MLGEIALYVDFDVMIAQVQVCSCLPIHLCKCESNNIIIIHPATYVARKKTICWEKDII